MVHKYQQTNQASIAGNELAVEPLLYLAALAKVLEAELVDIVSVPLVLLVVALVMSGKYRWDGKASIALARFGQHFYFYLYRYTTAVH